MAMTAMADTSPKAVPVAPACAHCVHRVDHRQALEQRIAGLAALGSGFGASVAQSRLCVLHDRLVSPDDGCGRFVWRG